MNEEFLNRLKEALWDEISKEYQIEEMRYVANKKNNGVVAEGLMLKVSGYKLMPCVYLDKYIPCHETSFDNTVKEIAKCYKKALENTEQLGDNFDLSYETVRDKLFISLINYQRNSERLEKCPYIMLNDLAIAFRVFLPVNNNGGSVLVDNNLAMMWGVNCEELWNTAIENMVREYPPVIRKLEDFLEGLIPFNSDDYGVQYTPIYVLTNDNMYYGASAILYSGITSELYDMVGEDYYLLPSSINEFLIIPANECFDIDYLKSMVTDINRTVVDATLYLSDSIYYYDHEDDKITKIL